MRKALGLEMNFAEKDYYSFTTKKEGSSDILSDNFKY